MLEVAVAKTEARFGFSIKMDCEVGTFCSSMLRFQKSDNCNSDDR